MNLNDSFFWKNVPKSYGLLQRDTVGSLKFVLLDKKIRMVPLIRKTRISFTDFLTTDSLAKSCLVVVNGNYYSTSKTNQALSTFGRATDPSQTQIEGELIDKEKLLAGVSEPESFWFGQLKEPTTDAFTWTYCAGRGDPPVDSVTMEAVGGLGPLIIDTLPYGIRNRYKAGGTKGLMEPEIGQPPPEATHNLIQRSNKRFTSVSAYPPGAGKTILAYCTSKRTLFVGVQPHGADPAYTYEALASALATQGFNFAVFLDGSTSTTMVYNGSLEAEPSSTKNGNIDVGIGFL